MVITKEILSGYLLNSVRITVKFDGWGGLDEIRNVLV